MASKFSLQEVQSLWQNQSLGASCMTLDEVRKKSEQFEKRVRRDNIELFGVYFFLIACFSLSIVVSSNLVQRGGALLTILGIGFVAHQIRQRQLQASVSTAMAAKMGNVTTVEIYRMSLERERDLFRGGSLWSRLISIAPGLPVLCIGEAIARPNEAPMLRVGVLAYFLFLAALLLLSLRRARQYQRQIDELGTLTREL